MNRRIKIATTSILTESSSPQSGKVVERALQAVRDAAEWKPDLIVLPEEIDCIGQTAEGRTGEPVPEGPIYEQFADLARSFSTNIVLGIREREGDRVYNVGAVIDRQGNLVGKYRKTHLAPGESDEVVPGDEYPVFQLDFGKIGVLLCMDIHYPEPWTILALQGADVIVHPAWWRDYTGNLCESLVNARAIDNQVYVVTSHPVTMPFLTGSAAGHSRIVDPYGRTMASTGHKPGVAVAEVDLDQAYEYWAEGDLKKQYPTLKECFLGMRRPETYGILTRPDSENNWKISEPTLFAKED